MSPFAQKIESFLGHTLASVRAHDAKLFLNIPAIKAIPGPTLTVTSPECGASDAQLEVRHTPLGQNRFPELQWNSMSKPLDQPNTKSKPLSEIVEYLVVVEDPDAPLPAPVVHGIYFSIPATKTSLSPADFDFTPGATPPQLQGGFNYGLNRRKCVWSGPRPVLGHGEHRYMFQVVALSGSISGSVGDVPSRKEIERAVEGKVVEWGVWVGRFTRDGS